jgi:hypothetical protein
MVVVPLLDLNSVSVGRSTVSLTVMRERFGMIAAAADLMSPIAQSGFSENRPTKQSPSDADPSKRERLPAA